MKLNSSNKKRIASLVDNLMSVMSLDQYSGFIEFYDHDDVYAEIAVDEQYKRFTIGFGKKCIAQNEVDTKQFKHLVAHELSHVITEPMYRIAIDAMTNITAKQLEHEREVATELISRFVMQMIKEDIPKVEIIENES